MFELLESYESRPITVNKDPPPCRDTINKTKFNGKFKKFQRKTSASRQMMYVVSSLYTHFRHYSLLVYQIFLFLQKWYCAAEWARGSYRTHRTSLFITHHHSTACKHMAVQRYATCWKDV